MPKIPNLNLFDYRKIKDKYLKKTNKELRDILKKKI